MQEMWQPMIEKLVVALVPALAGALWRAHVARARIESRNRHPSAARPARRRAGVQGGR